MLQHIDTITTTAMPSRQSKTYPPLPPSRTPAPNPVIPPLALPPRSPPDPHLLRLSNPAPFNSTHPPHQSFQHPLHPRTPTPHSTRRDLLAARRTNLPRPLPELLGNHNRRSRPRLPLQTTHLFLRLFTLLRLSPLAPQLDEFRGRIRGEIGVQSWDELFEFRSCGETG